ncbi:MAG: hypothetical protein NOF05_20050 [Candidatus Accumulibacter phosphatis]|nr:hypothetical protein [Candidatus Accumulibacter phosphatis]HNK51539.1 hypothetical protein [Nitrospira sp.]
MTASGSNLLPSAWYEHLLAQPEGLELAEAMVSAMEQIEAHNATPAGILPKAYRGFEPRLLMDPRPSTATP